MDGPVTDQDIDTIERLFRGIDLPPYINLCPFSHPTVNSHHWLACETANFVGGLG
ncbi:hypothetical protein ASPSYDRAFT_47243 [Aspergillus sydowii CBS 593.65]|uniref:Uncharacterized protein n=1 Tax=Aspergillus sydowii CBS 593.65 TaxID=1036612 RepID=A0A1L9TC14_9EURO|nr:uncharacterized protein ASPSYDRAFT_47243 [Aspergillus sydowii CBS 593.65]OJJ56974.1 hypothetical protein ASPSYDRAFT_47243 [Aspergillus sydowii CBS 593.65]